MSIHKIIYVISAKKAHEQEYKLIGFEQTLKEAQYFTSFLRSQGYETKLNIRWELL